MRGGCNAGSSRQSSLWSLDEEGIPHAGARGMQRETALADPRDIPHSGAWGRRISVFLGEEAVQGEAIKGLPRSGWAGWVGWLAELAGMGLGNGSI